MLTVTEAASARLAEMMEQKGLSQDVAIRFVSRDRGIAMQSGTERPGDATFQHEGRTVLLLDEKVSKLLADETLDVDGTEFTLHGDKEET